MDSLQFKNTFEENRVKSDIKSRNAYTICHLNMQNGIKR